MISFKPALYKIPAVIFALLQIFTFADAKDLEAVVSVDGAGSKVKVEGRFGADSGVTNRRNIAFATAVTGDAQLGKRITGLLAFDRSGKAIDLRKLMDGEFLAASDVERWEYVVDLAAGPVRAALAHRSWIEGNTGILMTDDLLPQLGGSASVSVKLNLPEGCGSFSQSEPLGEGHAFTGIDPRNGVFYIGKGFRRVSANDSSGLIVNGTFSFKDADAAAFTEQILGTYDEVFGAPPPERPLVVIMRFPGNVPPGSWEAEARGSSVTILSSDMAFPSQSLQRLHEQLRHELFHLWVPNGVELTGQYAWFYEGFALYQSLKTAVGLNRITFANMLDTLSRAWAIDRRQSPRKPLAVRGSSTNAVDTTTYARGMAIAFLADLRAIKNSRRKRGVAGVLRSLYRGHSRGTPKADADQAIAAALQDEDLLARYVYGSEMLDGESELEWAGLEFGGDKGDRALAVVAKPNGWQRQILDELGYNNWRKSIRRPNK